MMLDIWGFLSTRHVQVLLRSAERIGEHSQAARVSILFHCLRDTEWCRRRPPCCIETALC